MVFRHFQLTNLYSDGLDAEPRQTQPVCYSAGGALRPAASAFIVLVAATSSLLHSLLKSPNMDIAWLGLIVCRNIESEFQSSQL